MKKNLFYYLFAVICSVCVFTACSDDDEDTTWQQIPEITSDNVTLKLNNNTPTGATATCDIINGESAKVTLVNAIYGHPSVAVNVTLEKKSDTSYSFSGTTDLEAARMEASNSPLKVAVSGTVDTAGKMTIDVVTSGWAAVSGVYAKDSLTVTVNGTSQASTHGVTLVATAEDAAQLTFSKIVNVANDFEMNVTLKDGKIEGSKEYKTGYMINVTGTLTSDKLTLAVTTSGWATVSNTYYAKDHKFTFNGVELPTTSNAYFSIKMTAEDKADISFNNLLSGDRSGVIKNAVVTVKDGVYNIKGSSEATGYKLTFDGTLNSERVLTATANYITISPLVGTWAPKIVSSALGNMVATDIKFVTKSGNVTFSKEIIEMLPAELKPMFAETMPDTQVAQVLQGLLGTYAVYLNSLTFTEDGRMVVKYVNMPKDTNGDGKIDANDTIDTTVQEFSLLKYYIGSDNKLYLTVNIMDLMGMIPMDERAAWNPGNALTEGIPFNMDVNGNDALISIDQDVLNIKTVEFVSELLGMFGPMIPGFAEQTELINTVMGVLTSVLGDTQALSAGIYFTKK